MKVLLDTCVYLDALRSQEARARFRATFFPLLPATVLSAVVAYELSVDAADRRTRERLAEFVGPMERAGRVVTPTFDDWKSAAGVISAVRTRDAGWRAGLPHLLNDVLIALAARRVGAELVTSNAKHFRLIRRHLPFALRLVAAG